MQFNIEEELKKLPAKPGVYLMHDEADAIIYVGKAISLKNRVKQYFQSSRNKGPKIEQMVTHIDGDRFIRKAEYDGNHWRPVLAVYEGSAAGGNDGQRTDDRNQLHSLNAGCKESD